MRKLQSQGCQHITLVGADRQTSIDFWEGVLGMPWSSSSPTSTGPTRVLYFDPGDGRLITVFTNDAREPGLPHAADIGCVEHVAFAVSQAAFPQAVERLDERGIEHSGVKDRGFMDSIYFTTRRPADRAGLLPIRAAGRPLARRRPARGASHPRRARRLQHRPRTPRRRDRGLVSRSLRLAVGGPLTEGRVPLSMSRRPRGGALAAVLAGALLAGGAAAPGRAVVRLAPHHPRPPPPSPGSRGCGPRGSSRAAGAVASRSSSARRPASGTGTARTGSVRRASSRRC